MSRYKFLAVVFLLLSTFAKAQFIPAWKLKDLQAVMDTSQSPTIINFWATFCKPCLAELPAMQALAKKYKSKGVKLLLVSLDLKEAYPAAIKATAKKRGLTAPISYLDETDADLFCPAVDSSWSGVLPATLFFSKKTGYRKFYEEELKALTIEAEIKAMLSPAKKPAQ